MYRYETLFILHPELPEAQVRETTDRVRRLVEGMQGQISGIHDWGVRDLAYPIRKQGRGTYVLVEYSARPEVVKELERNLKLADEVLRFISVRPAELRPSARQKPALAPVPTSEVDAASLEQGS